MSFDFTTLITDRTQADVDRVKAIAKKIENGTASESEIAEFNGAAMKGAYNYTDLNRVTAAMEYLKSNLEGYGYAVPGYQRIEVPHPSENKYDPYLWYEVDWPTETTMITYLGNIAAIRSVLAVLTTTPVVPVDMVGFMAEEANNIETILIDVSRQLDILPTTFIPSGEALSGGDNL